MEILFENTHIRNGDSVKEMYLHLILKRPIMYVLYAVVALSALVTLGSAVFYRVYNLSTIMIALAGMAVLYLLIRNIVKNAVRQMERTAGDEPVELTTTVTEQSIRSVSRLGETEMDWSKIVKAEQSKNYVYLRTGSNVIFVLAKNGFTKGCYEDFCTFLRGKRLMR